MKFLLIILLLISNQVISSVFKNISDNPIVLSEEILNLIDQELLGSKKHDFQKPIINAKTNNQESLLNQSKLNLCYRFNFFTNELNHLILKPYSNSKIFVPEINKSGELNFSVKNLPNNLQVSFSSDGYIPVNLYLGNSAGVEVECNDYDIPIFSTDLKLNIIEDKSSILIANSEIFDEIIVEDKNQIKIYLNEEFNITKKQSESKFVLYTNLSPGNTIIKYGIPSKGIASELIHLIVNEITFLDDRFVDIEKLKIEFFKRNLLSNTNEPFVENRKLKNILPGFFKTNMTNDGTFISSIKRKNSKLLVHNDQKIQGKNLYYHFGISDQKLIIPSNDYANLFFERNNLDNDREFCIVEFNLNPGTVEMYAAVSNGETIDSPDMIIKDKYGNMSSVVKINSESAYLIGYLDGVIDYRIVYQDGTSQYGQVPCSNNSYIIEQLI